jgi:hypothetical protein
LVIDMVLQSSRALVQSSLAGSPKVPLAIYMSSLEVFFLLRVFTYVHIYMSGWWFQTFFIFHFIYGIILSIDFHMFQRG